jgi:hypothetical protein
MASFNVSILFETPPNFEVFERKISNCVLLVVEPKTEMEIE